MNGSIISTICHRQINCNMQQHMRKYANSKINEINESPSEKIIEELGTNLHNSIAYASRFIYGNIGLIKYNINNPDIFCSNQPNFDIKLIAKYLEMVNDKLLSNPNFGKKLPVKSLGSKNILLPDPNNLKSYSFGDDRKESTIFFYYIAGVKNNDPNIVRMTISEKIKSKEHVQGSIDFYSNGQIISNSFQKSVFSNENNKWQNTKISINDTSIVPNQINILGNYIMQVFKESNLLTENIKPYTKKMKT